MQDVGASAAASSRVEYPRELASARRVNGNLELVILDCPVNAKRLDVELPRIGAFLLKMSYVPCEHPGAIGGGIPSNLGFHRIHTTSGRRRNISHLRSALRSVLSNAV